MKKVFLVLSIVSICLSGMAQQKITQEQARSICAQEMASFTKVVSGAYKKGMSYDAFQYTLCGKWQPAIEGSNQLKTAFNFLSAGTTTDQIIKTYDGKEVAAAMNFLSQMHNKGVASDGSELFGGKTGVINNVYGKEAGGCRWYQFWCLVQEFANWVVENWPVISQIFIFFGIGNPVP